jgi:hypothetical protein
LLAWIVEQIDRGRFAFTAHALTTHPFAEGFTPGQALTAVRHGRVIERRDDHRRCLVVGACADLAQEPRFLGRFVHAVVSWDAPQGVIIVTMYRPRTERWRTEAVRRSPGEGAST